MAETHLNIEGCWPKLCVCSGVWTLQGRKTHQTRWQSIIRWAGQQVCLTQAAQIDKMISQNRCMCVLNIVCVTDRCRSVVEKFLSLDLEDKDLDLQHFMKEDLLPSAGELLNHSWTVSVATASIFLQLCGQCVQSPPKVSSQFGKKVHYWRNGHV